MNALLAFLFGVLLAFGMLNENLERRHLLSSAFLELRVSGLEANDSGVLCAVAAGGAVDVGSASSTSGGGRSLRRVRRVIGGARVERSAAPWLASVRVRNLANNNIYHCGATLVHSQ